MSDETAPWADRAHYFILNVGRSGSSLLSAVLADAGANFGIAPPDDWDPRTGQMEIPAIKRAAHEYRRAHDIGEGRKFLLSPVLERKLRLARARRQLREALGTSRFFKIGDLDLVVQPAFKLGIEPTVILNYRQLEPMMPSLLVGRTHVGADELARDYVRIYRQGLSLLETFGGCVIEFNDLLDQQEAAWSDAVAGVTGFNRDQLLAARAKRVNGTSDPREVTPIYPEAYDLFRAMQAYRGRTVARSRQAERAIRARRA